ncbi:MAG: fatty acid desaturase CarF family protein [Acidobacteriota bacterium]|jgi:ubiquitin-conjugating enzyme E2 variant
MSPRERPPGDPFIVEPYSPREVRFHVTGGVLDGACWLAAVAWLATAGREAAPAWPWIVLAVLAGVYLADLASGLLHWAFDTWFDADVTFVRRMVLQVREHHIHPSRIFLIPFVQDAGTLSWIALLVTAPALAWALAGGGAVAYGALLTAAVFNPLLVFMLEFHKCGHRPAGAWWVKALQRAQLVLPVDHHLRHHSGNHDINYCIINGWADRTLGRLGLFRGLEWAIERTTGARPQRDDHEWFRRFDRPVVGRGGGRRDDRAGDGRP